MSEFAFSCTVTKGKVLPAEPAQWIVWLAKHEGKRVTVTVETEKHARSLAQNRRYWSLVVPVAAEVLSQGRRLPLSKDQAHFVLKSAFIGTEETLLGPVPKSSKELTTAQFAEFCRKVEEWLLHTWGVVMPEQESA